MTLAPQPDYHDPTHSPTPSRPERRGISRRSVIEEAKDKVKTIDLADLLCGPGRMRKVGERWVARCPLPGHEDRSPSFTVYPETNSWFCFGACLAGGDVIELARHAWGYSKPQVAMAAAYLLHEFGHKIPPRPAAWFKKEDRQRPIRNAIEEAKVHHLQRRVFRIFVPLVEEVEGDEEQREEARYLWDAAGEIAVLVAAGSSRS
jgi:hypothetical protein